MLIQLDKETVQERLVELIFVSTICWAEINSEAWDRDMFLSDYPGKWNYSFAWLQDDIVIAFVIATTPDEPNGGQRDDGGVVVYIHKLVVLPQYRRQGIALDLRRRVAEIARLNRVAEIRSSVDHNNPKARAFVERHGSHFVRDIVNHEGKDMWLMSLEL